MSNEMEGREGQFWLTCVIPCYNSEAYMERAVNSVLPGGPEVEILIVDDGSTDRTGEIADRLAEAHPEQIRVHHQPNGGHGSGLNYGIRHARGTYLKILDSDDRLNTDLLPGLLEVLRRFGGREDRPDLIFHDYVYDNPGKEAVFRITYRGRLKPDTLSTWDDTARFHLWNQFMMHSLIFRTELLREMDLTLPEHVYYEDCLYQYLPLAKTRRILYHPAELYGYFVGREDQSINRQVVQKRIRMLTEVSEQMVTSYSLEELNQLPGHLRNYMINFSCGQIYTTSALQYMEGTEQGEELNREMWEKIRAFDPTLYRRLRRNPLTRLRRSRPPPRKSPKRRSLMIRPTT